MHFYPDDGCDKMKCELCPRRCGVDRAEKVGYCGVGETVKIARAAPHFWEEPCISGTKGSGTVFFSGCSLRCVFCQNYQVSHAALGADVDEDKLLRIFDYLINQGVHNINLVTPTHYTAFLAGALRRFQSPVPVVWNSGGYETTESLRMLEGLVDIYLPDIKFYDSAVSQKYAGAADYFERASEAVLEMQRQVGTLCVGEDGLATRGLLIRHLVLPGNVGQTFRVLQWVADNLPPETAVSLMRQYTPFGDAENMPPLNRKLSSREYTLARQRVLDLGFENCYFQKKESAAEAFIPDFSAESIDL